MTKHRNDDPTDTPLPEEITGKASGTDEDLEELFDDETDEHLADGFKGGSEDDPDVHEENGAE